MSLRRLGRPGLGCRGKGPFFGRGGAVGLEVRRVAVGAGRTAAAAVDAAAVYSAPTGKARSAHPRRAHLYVCALGQPEEEIAPLLRLAPRRDGVRPAVGGHRRALRLRLGSRHRPVAEPADIGRHPA
eukprot:4190901-Prymnesium_polylepis.1